MNRGKGNEGKEDKEEEEGKDDKKSGNGRMKDEIKKVNGYEEK